MRNQEFKIDGFDTLGSIPYSGFSFLIPHSQFFIPQSWDITVA